VTGLPSGVVEVTLVGAAVDVAELAAMLAGVTLHRKGSGTRAHLTVLIRAEVTDCRCGRKIRPCGDGDTSCLGWVHAEPRGHWCGDRLDDGCAYPAAPATLVRRGQSPAGKGE
jgi:hypothetical protein